MPDTPPRPSTCVTCGAELTGAWCAACGEKVLGPDDHRLSSFVRRAAAGAFDLDSRLWRTLGALLTRPGRLTAEYVRGRRKPWLRPLQLFLLTNLVFFVVLGTVGGLNTFTTQVRYHVGQPIYGSVAEELVSRHGRPGSPERAEYVRRFDRASPRYANSLVILMVPLQALAFALLYGFRKPFVHHLVFSLHYHAYMLAVITAVPLAFAGMQVVWPGFRHALARESVVTGLFLTLFGLWLYAGFRRAWGEGRTAALLRALGATLAFVPVVTIYRAVLFFAVWATLDR